MKNWGKNKSVAFIILFSIELTIYEKFDKFTISSMTSSSFKKVSKF